LQLLGQSFETSTIDLFRQALTSASFLYSGQFYDQADGVTMDSPLAPVVANFCMEHFEQQALVAASLKLVHWYRCIDDTFAIRPHGKDELGEVPGATQQHPASGL
jgi:hypothetical protein